MGRNAVILVDKGEGITSFDCLGRIKHNVNKKTGHCGTLDRFAHGLIVVLCGTYTHMVPAFMGLDKTYEATIEFGRMTDTLDPEGEVLETDEIPDLETIKKAVAKLTGDIMQMPPLYSAIHVNGKRSYQMARSGQEVELTPRPIKIYKAEILSWEAPFLKIRLEVSKGTYIRSYARDLGHECCSCAYVKELYRTKIGPFSIDEAIRYDDIEAMQNLADSEGLISGLPGFIRMEVDDTEAFKAKNGYVLPTIRKRIPEGTRFAMLLNQGEAVCIYAPQERKILCQMGVDNG